MGGAARDGVVTADVVAEVIPNSSKKAAVAVVAVDVEVAVAEEVAAGGRNMQVCQSLRHRRLHLLEAFLV